ncbi:MAG: 50S ribosomal protein L7/L12 [Spirochaetota bacterium]|nr:50S ribosomal protein L7/L12 [Spirochaetota bacterium]
MADNVTKVFDLIKDLTVLELNDLRKKIEVEFDVQATVAAAPAAGAGDAGDAASTTVSVFVTDPGTSKIEVIKAIRELTGLGLKEAKEMAESKGATPLKADIEQAEADQIAEKLKAAGAVVEIK